MHIWPGSPYPLGATFDGGGTNFAHLLRGRRADRAVPVRRHGPGNRQSPGRPARAQRAGVARLPAPGRARPALRLPGARPVRPGRGCAATRPSCCSTRTPRPSTGASTGTRRCSATASATRSSYNDADSAPYAMTSVVINPFFDWADDRPLRIPYNETVIYEAHVKGMTMRHPGIPEDVRGTYAGLAHPAMIRHFRQLGVTAVELMPVHQFVHDSTLVERGLSQLLGLQHHRLLRPAQRLRLLRHPRRAGAGVQDDGPGAAPGRASRSSSTSSTTTPPRATTSARRCRSAASTTRPTTGWSTATSSTTTTPPAPATASTSATTSRCG